MFLLHHVFGCDDGTRRQSCFVLGDGVFTRHTERETGQKYQRLPLWEWNHMQNYNFRQQREQVASLEQELEAAERTYKPQIEERIQDAKNQTAI